MSELKRPHILVVDDEPAVQHSLEACLKEAGHSCLMASDGKGALNILKANPSCIQAVLLDWRMPEMDGMAVLAEMRTDPKLFCMPVIMLTGLAKEEEIRQGIDAGVFYYLTKPFTPEVLLAVVASALRSHRQWKEIHEELEEFNWSLHFMETGKFRVTNMKELHALAMLLAQACPDPNRVIMGLCDLLANAVEHGNLGISFEEKTRLQEEEHWEEEIETRLALPENAGKSVEVVFERLEGKIRISIKDNGIGFDWKPYLELNPDLMLASHGRGIAMAKALSFDEVEYQGKGNEVVCTIAIPQHK